MESMESQMLHFTVVLVIKVENQRQLNYTQVEICSRQHFILRTTSYYLFEEEVIGKVVEHHGVAGVNGIGP